VYPSNAASVVEHNRRTAERSNSGGDRGPRRRPDLGRDPVELTDVVESFCGMFPSVCFNLFSALGVDVLESSALIDGKISFFCFDAGKISSKSTGTPKETRNRRRIRDLTQFGGCNGGGATNCDHRESERSLLKMAVESGMGSRAGREEISCVSGKRVSRESLVADNMSDKEVIELKSNNGGCSCQYCSWPHSCLLHLQE
jgi:hypothetical protein